MTAVRDDLIRRIWRGHDPFEGFHPQLYRSDYGGWGSNHSYLSDTVKELRPDIVLEIGVWNGGSVRTMGEALREIGSDSAIIAVDTWLGSAEHWLTDAWPSLCFAQGRPQKQAVFMTNVVEWGLETFVVPLPLDSLNASQLMAACGIQPSVIHLDGAHDYESVSADLRVWWPRLKPGGVLIGDDYYDDGVSWPGVFQAFQEFYLPKGLTPIQHKTGKCRVLKP